MKQDTGFIINLVKLGLIFVLVVVVLISIFQASNFEDQIIEVKQEIEELRHAINRGGAAFSSNGRPPTQTDTIPDENYGLTLLNPDLANEFTPDPFVLRADDAVEGGTLVGRLGQDFQSLNPILSNISSYSSIIDENVLMGIASYHYKNPMVYAGNLAFRAEMVEREDGGLDYVIYLRPGVYWHRPSVDWTNPQYEWLKGEHEVTVDDFIFTLDIIQNPDVQAGHLQNYYKDLESIEKINDYVMIFHWKEKLYIAKAFTFGFPYVPKFIYSHYADGTPIPEAMIGMEFNNHWFNDKVIGCGPYRFVEYHTGDYLLLERNEEYLFERPAIDQLKYLIFQEDEQTLLKLKSGELDVGSLTSSQYREEILEAGASSIFANDPAIPKIQYRVHPAMVYYYIGWNLRDPLFSDAQVRKALTMACNRQFMLNEVFLGMGNVATGSFYSGSYQSDPSIDPYPFDLDQAADILHSAGWEDVDNDGVLEKEINGELKDFAFSLSIYGASAEWKTIADIYKSDLEKIGIKITVEALDGNTLYDKLDNRDFQASTGGWSMGYESDPYQLWHSSQADQAHSSNYVGFKNEEADQIIEEARITFDMHKRQELFHRFHSILHEEQPYIFLWERSFPYVWQYRVKNVILKETRPYFVPRTCYLEGSNP